jgi:hypothetical protein
MSLTTSKATSCANNLPALRSPSQVWLPETDQCVYALDGRTDRQREGGSRGDPAFNSRAFKAMNRDMPMPRTIAINGTKLDEVRMPMKPPDNKTVAYLSYPISQIRCSRDACGLCLVVPAYLAVELYRICILPQDENLPVEISIDGRASGWYTVSDVRYPDRTDSPFGEVTFALAHVRHGNAVIAAGASRLPDSAVTEGTYVTDITHYLDETGEMAQMPAAARKLASFLTLLIDAATGAPSDQAHDSRIRCRTRACKGKILTTLPPNQHEITWHCPACEHHGVIRNWQDTKWNQLKRR